MAPERAHQWLLLYPQIGLELVPQIASRVQKTLQRDVPSWAMFECGTVAELAEYIEGLAANEISAEKVERLSDLMAELEGL